MKFSKFNNPSKRKHSKPCRYSVEYRESQRDDMMRILSQCKTEEEKANVLKAFSVSINP